MHEFALSAENGFVGDASVQLNFPVMKYINIVFDYTPNYPTACTIQLKASCKFN